MIVYKFGGATTRTRRGLDALVALVDTVHRSEVTRRRRSRAAKPHANFGLVIVASAIGHTTRHLARAAELSASGNLALAEDTLARTLEQHRQLLRTLRLDAEEEVLERFDEIAEQIRALMEGVAITRELSARSRDAIVANGEELATAILEAALHEHGVPVSVVDARQIVITDENYGHAHPNYDEITARVAKFVLPHLRRSEVVLTQGFIGATLEGDTTTMGSESSDLSATLIAAALAAEEVVIWKTLPGIYTADPELVPEAKLIKALSFAEAEEIGRRGARILFPSVAHPLLRAEHDAVLRIATPLARSERHTSLQRTLPAPRQERALAIAVEQNLLLLRITRSGMKPARKPLGLESLLAEATHIWMSGEEVRALVHKDQRSTIANRLAANGWTLQSAEPVGTVGIVVRRAKSDTSEFATMTTVLRSVRALPALAVFTIESSIVVCVAESALLGALRKLHKDIFSA